MWPGVPSTWSCPCCPSESCILHTHHPHSSAILDSLSYLATMEIRLRQYKSSKLKSLNCGMDGQWFNLLFHKVKDQQRQLVSSCGWRLFLQYQAKTSSVTVKMDISVYSVRTSVFPIKPSAVCGHEHLLLPK